MPAFVVDEIHVKVDDTIESTLVNLGLLFTEENTRDSDSSRFPEKNDQNINTKDSDSSRFTEKNDNNINVTKSYIRSNKSKLTWIGYKPDTQ